MKKQASRSIPDDLTRIGTRVRYAPTKKERRSGRRAPQVGELGTTEQRVRGKGAKVYEPDTDGGVVNVVWDDAGPLAVPPASLVVMSRAPEEDPWPAANKVRDWVDEETRRTLRLRGTVRNPVDPGSPLVWLGAAVAVVAVAAIGYAVIKAPTTAPPGTPPTGGMEGGQDVAVRAFDLRYEETDPTGSPQPAQTVMLVYQSRRVPGRWFVNLPNGEAGWADVVRT